jgi:dUTP pyrophosphatase
MRLPEGFEAHILPRSSTPKGMGIMCANSMGIIDNSYSGNDDEWKFPAIAIRDTTVSEGERICQFRICLSQKATLWQRIKWLFSSGIEIIETDELSSENRGGFGSTGNK